MEQLYVKETDIPKTNTRIEFIRKFIDLKPNSYSDENCNVLQCERGRFRSITELHQIVLSRFPKTSFEAILRIVKELIRGDKPISMVWCTQVNKVVLRYLDSATREYISDYSIKHYYSKVGVDGYSLEDYNEILNKLK